MNKIINTQPIAILMATYNGEEYLQEQLDSLYKQTCLQFTLYVHDDGSKDQTLAILKHSAECHENMVVLEYSGGNGAKDNFLGMMQRVESQYYMFCDQDDVWLREKVEISTNTLKEVEKDFAEEGLTEVPAMVFSDLKVVDSSLNEISSSFWKFAGIRPDCIRNFNELAAGFLTTGCTMMFNRAARDATLQHGAQAASMHDAWVTACTMKHEGIVRAIAQPLVLYRQHDNNTFGAQDHSKKSIMSRFTHIKEVWNKNKTQYEMFQSLGYGSIMKYIYEKIKFNGRIHKRNF